MSDQLGPGIEMPSAGLPQPDMKLKPEQPINSAALPPTPEVSFDVLTQKRTALVEAMTKAQQLPDAFVSPDGRSKNDLLTAMRAAMGGLEEELGRFGEKAKPETLLPTDTGDSKTDKKTTTKDKVQEKVDTSLHYITIGKTHIPVVHPPRQRRTWEAVPGEMYVEGGKKWSRVRFEKLGEGGFAQRLRPGDQIMFGEHQGERVEVIDNILEGRGEVLAFNEAIHQLAALREEYQSLNPDVEGYDDKASELAEKIAKFRTGNVSEVVDVSRFKIDDLEGFSGRVGDVISTLEYLQEIDPDYNEFIPSVDSHFKLTPFFEGKLAWYAELVNRQMGLGNNQLLERLVADNQAPEWKKLEAKGMTVMVGPRGVGKNKMVDYYCAVTNRPLYRYTCSPDKEERDLTFDVVLQDGEVVRVPSRIITAITTPNALLELDEVNLLRPSEAKFLNSLLDGDRAVFLNNEVIQAAPGVAITGLMNPAYYEGVEDLPETIDDRSNAMSFGYPPLQEIDRATNTERFTHDEGTILKDYIAPLAQMNDQEFRQVWDQVHNNVSSGRSIDPEVIQIVKDLKNIIAIANRTRETVRAYKTRTGDTRMEREVSLRGSIEAAKLYSEKHLWKADLTKLPEYKTGWNASQYAIAATYMPHTQTYRRGESDRQALEVILTEQLTRP